MLTALDAPDDALDEHERNFVANIREHGWFAMNVFAGDGGPGFLYSTGFWKTLGIPELIVFSLKSDDAHRIFWDFFNDAKAGRQLQIGKRLDKVVSAYDVVLLPVDKRYYREHLGWSRWFYAGDSFPCLQLIWPDSSNRFPWDDGFDTLDPKQPDLSEIGWQSLGNQKV